MSNRVDQINATPYVKGRYTRTEQSTIAKERLEISLKAPNWLSKPEKWPAVVQTKPSKETEAEAKLVKEVFAGATEIKDTQHQVLEKHGFWQTIRITSWEATFIQNCKIRKEVRVVWPLTTCEPDKQVKFWLGRAQNSRLNTDTFYEDQVKLNLKKNKEGQHECRGRMQGSYPIY